MYIKTLALLSMMSSVVHLTDDKSYTIKEFGAVPNDNNDDSLAFNHAFSSIEDGSVIFIPPGNYDICNTVYLIDKKNLSLVGSKGTTLKKCINFSDEYLFYIRNGDELLISNIYFHGLFNGGDTPNWGKQGLYLASTTNSIVTYNRFSNFGDAALRITTSPSKDAVESRNNIVLNNQFSNCAQVTTTQATSNSNVASTHNIVFQSNKFDNCTLKLSSRQATKGAMVIDNSFSNISGTAIEASYYSDIVIADNQFNDILGFLINVYPNSRAEGHVAWGNIAITNNDFNRSTLGIRLQSFSATETPTQPIQNLMISNNRFDEITCEGTDNTNYKKLIRTYSQNPTLSFENVFISNNSLISNEGCDYLGIDARDRNVVID
ncbi:glycosyl hydrolase family 28-related protein [Vibrio sp. PNB22_4_1]